MESNQHAVTGIGNTEYMESNQGLMYNIFSSVAAAHV
jgi:hypothetical protein